MKCHSTFVQKLILGSVVVALLVTGPSPARADDVPPAKIQEAIDKAKAYLYAQEKDGNWEVVPAAKATPDFPNNPSGMQFGGMTALATFALLSCGDTPQNNDGLKQAVEWLEKTDITGNYALGLRAQIWSLLPDDEATKRCRKRDKDLLLKAIHTKGEDTSFYSYGETNMQQYGPSTAITYDHSVSQFGVLGLWSIVQTGEEVQTHYWREFDAAWRSHQHPDGGWGYRKDNFHDNPGQEGQGGELMSMTAAGVATLFITQDYANLSSKCDGNIRDHNIESGMDWIGKHFETFDEAAWAQMWRYYTMFGICRIGLASGYKYIGTTNWFQWGAGKLLSDQDAGGSWTGNMVMSFGKGTDPVQPAIYNSSFALLFLSRGRAPVLFNKLQYNLSGSSAGKSVEASWNQRPRDVANITRFLGRATETTLNWQIVNLQQSADDLMDAPLLYMAGNQVIKLSTEDMTKLRDYVNAGGIIVGHADCASALFDDSFKKLGQQLFPGDVFRTLPADHPLCTSENYQAKNWNPKPRVEILENGARIRMLLLANGDPARDWQTQSFLPLKKYSFGQLMMDIYLYAVDKQPPRYKGDTFIVKRDASIDAASTAKVARLQYTGNWDPEPGGWPRLANIVHNKNKIDLTITPVELGKGLLTADYKLADLTGTAALKLSDDQEAELKKYVDGGGTLLIDAAGGNSAFAASAQALVTKLFAGATINPLAADNSIYTIGDPITEVTYRQFARLTLGNLRAPHLRGVKTGNRTGVILSDEDLAVGLVGQPVDGVRGYAPDSAAHIVQNIILSLTGSN